MNGFKALMLAGALVLSSSLTAMPDGGKPGPGMMHGGGKGGHGGMAQILKKLDLTKEQTAKLKELRKARRDRNQALGNKLEDAHEALEELLEVADKSKAHEDKIRAKHDEILKLQQERQKDHFETMLEIRSVLTDAQLKKFVELHGAMMDKKEHMQEMRKQRGKQGHQGKGKPKDGGDDGDDEHEHGGKDKD